MVLGMAPLCDFYIYDNAAQSDLIGVLTKEVNDNLADVISESYGWSISGSTITSAHNLHLSTLPGFTLPGDVAASERYFAPDLIDPPITVNRDGTIDVPQGHGIGVDPVPDRVRRAALHTEMFQA